VGEWIGAATGIASLAVSLATLYVFNRTIKREEKSEESRLNAPRDEDIPEIARYRRRTK
jgi:hypothetical protein